MGSQAEGHRDYRKAMTDNNPSQLRWSYLSTISTTTLQLLASATITRFLQPSDYGLAAMAVLCSGLAGYFTQLGMGRAVVQKLNLTDGNIRASFTLSLLTGLGGFIVVCALAPLLATYFREPRLTVVLIVFALNIVFQSASMVTGGLLRREFRMRDLAVCDFVGYALSTFGLGLPLAMKGFGVWALVASNVSQPLIVAIAYFVARPHSVVPTMKRADYRHITIFGGKASVTTSVEALGTSLDTLIMGRLVGPGSLGIYNRGLTLSTQPGYNVSMGLTRVFHPTIARAAERGIAECRDILKNSERQLMAIIMPVCAGAAIASPTIIPAIFGKQWTSAIPVYQVLCLVAALDATFHLPAIQLEVMNLFRHKFIIQTIFAIAFGAGIVLVAHWGIVAVALLYAALQLLRSLGLHWLSARSLDCSIWSLLKVWLPGIICSAFVGITIHFVQGMFALLPQTIEPAFRLIALVLLAGVVAVGVYKIIYKDSVYEPWMLVLGRKGRNEAINVDEEARVLQL
jgi:O-antigen/teichoic acid export membrane protein